MRKAISTRTRFEIFKRDNFTCQYCGANPQTVVLHVDHITPVSKGGDNSRENLITACASCNLGKSNVPISSIPKSLEEQANETAEREKQIRAFKKIFKQRKARIEEEVWDIVRIYTKPNSEGTLSIGKKDFLSIQRFIDKIGFTEVEEAMEIATDKCGMGSYKAFKYFCGICWTKYRNMQEAA